MVKLIRPGFHSESYVTGGSTIEYYKLVMSYPGNLTKSNSKDLQISLVSTLELCSNKSLCQESDIPLIH